MTSSSFSADYDSRKDRICEAAVLGRPRSKPTSQSFVTERQLDLQEWKTGVLVYETRGGHVNVD